METNTERMFLINDVSSAFPVHPGEILGEELKARGISQKMFAETVGLQATHLSALIHGARNITPAVAAKIAEGLNNIPADFWIRLQERYNLDIQRQKVNPSKLVSGYGHSTPTVQPAYLAEPDTINEGMARVILTIPVSDKDLLKTLASRLGWLCD